MKKVLFFLLAIGITTIVNAQNTFPTSGQAIINYDAGAALKIETWNRFGSTSGGHYPYWGMNVQHTSSGWNSFHSSLRGSLILNWGNEIRFASTAPNTNGASLVEHMRINTLNGNVGIGESSPTYRLHVKQTAANTPVALFENTSSSFSSDHLFTIRGQGGPTTGSSLFRVQRGSNTAMHVRWDGNVGIGTTSPNYKTEIRSGALGLAGGSESFLEFHGIYSSPDAGKWRMFIGGGQSSFNITTRYDNGNQKQNVFNISNSGNVGIGLTGANSRLELKQPDDVTSAMKIHNGTGRGAYMGYTGTYFFDLGTTTNDNVRIGQITSSGSGGVSLFTNANERLTVKSDGKVGIGLSDPSSLLQIHSSDNPTLTIGKANTNTNGQSTLKFQAGTATNKNGFLVEYHKNSSTDRLAFVNGGLNEMMTLANGGNVGIGKSNPAYKLDVAGDGSFGGTLHINKNGLTKIRGSYLQLNTDDSQSSSFVEFNDSNGTKYAMGSGIESNGYFSISNWDSSTELLRMNNNGNTFIYGELESTRVKVSESPGNWPDYVFEEHYELRDISDVAKFVKENKHLPEVPSAKEVEEKGIDLGNMDATLLKKVEELTLYLIEQDKKQKDMEERLEKLEKENAALKKQIKKKN